MASLWRFALYGERQRGLAVLRGFSAHWRKPPFRDLALVSETPGEWIEPPFCIRPVSQQPIPAVHLMADAAETACKKPGGEIPGDPFYRLQLARVIIMQIDQFERECTSLPISVCLAGAPCTLEAARFWNLYGFHPSTSQSLFFGAALQPRPQKHSRLPARRANCR